MSKVTTALPMINSVNSFDPDQVRQTDSKLFDTLIAFLKEYYEKVNFEKKIK